MDTTTVSPKIFVVEDDVFYKEVVKKSLANNNFKNVRTFSSGAEFLKQFEQEKPDLVVLDYHLGDMDGLKIFEKIKSSHPEIPVVMISGQDKEDVVSKALRMGVLDYITKDKTAFSKLRVIAMKTESEIESNLEKKKEEKLALLYTIAVMLGLGLIGILYLIFRR
jgi:DNA-binding NtrC family response regulator